jgi:pimeloyl-ACP methyl ester carboxylesterase
MFFRFFAGRKAIKGRLLLAFVSWVVVGCAINTPETRVSELLTQAQRQQFRPLQTVYPGLILVQNFERAATPLWVFIEGDGAPFSTTQPLSKSNPTPRHSIALKLAIDNHGYRTSYFSRPCQHIDHATSPHCRDESIWQARRFSAQVLNLITKGLDDLLRNAPGDVVLVGHSGGGPIALGLAARRPDRVRCVVTLASPMYLTEWAQYHQIRGLEIAVEESPLTLPKTIRLHAVFGDTDEVIGADLTADWIKHSAKYDVLPPKIELITATHTRGWINFWKKNRSRLCSAEKTRNYSIRHEDDPAITSLYLGSIAGAPLE